jgi:hypothetical protein
MADEQPTTSLEDARSKVVEAVAAAAEMLVTRGRQHTATGGEIGIDAGQVLQLAQAWKEVNAAAWAPPHRGGGGEVRAGGQR